MHFPLKLTLKSPLKYTATMNRLLLDSHIFLWAINDSPELSKSAKRLIQTTPLIYISALSIFELKAKQAKGKLKLPGDLLALTEAQGFVILDLAAKQLDGYRVFHSANTDPVDNALLTIAETQHLHFLTADRKVMPLHNSYSWIVAA